jgi:hypothetical protein
LLGYSPEARVLIINADDFGMHPSVNSAVLRSIECGLPALAASCRHVLAPANLGLALVEEYWLAARVWLDPSRHTARQLGLPVVDHDFLDSFSLDIERKMSHYLQLLHELPAGLSE